MLMDIGCSVINSIKVNLIFDDRSTKSAIIGVGDLLDVTYNANGLRKNIEGKVVKVSAVGIDPKGWYIIVDGSGDFESEQAKFSPMSILDVNIIRKADTLDYIKTPIGNNATPYLRVVDGRLQWSKDSETWNAIKIDSRDVIESEIESASY